MYCAHESSIQIRDRCTFGSNSFLEVGQNGDIKIGKDCMISSEVILQGCDSHLMFDIDTKAMLNAEKDYFIRLGEHVWMGKRSSALYGADIGSGGIVGMNGFVNKKIPNNVVIAGNPAKVVRENVAWSRQDAVSFQVQDMSEFDYR